MSFLRWCEHLVHYVVYRARCFTLDDVVGGAHTLRRDDLWVALVQFRRDLKAHGDDHLSHANSVGRFGLSPVGVFGLVEIVDSPDREGLVFPVEVLALNVFFKFDYLPFIMAKIICKSRRNVCKSEFFRRSKSALACNKSIALATVRFSRDDNWL